MLIGDYNLTEEYYKILYHDKILIVIYKCITYENGSAFLGSLNRFKLKGIEIFPFN